VPVAEAVERLAGMQAQEPRHPYVGLWTRVEGFEREQLHDALQAREVVRATLMRATLHLLSARDYASFRAALEPALAGAMRGLGKRGEGLDLEALLPVAHAALEDRPRGFKELRALLSEAFPDVNERALGYATRLRLPLVMVPTDDRWGFPSVSDFALADDWLGRLSAVDDDDAAAEALALRYLAAFGPATAADMQTWSGLKGMKPVLEGLRGELAVFEDEGGRELFDLPDAPRPDGDAPAPVRFLPDFDNLVLSHADRTRIMADEHRGAVVTKNLRVRATFLVDGFVTGTWKVERKGRSATLLIEPFRKLTKRARDDLTAEADALLRFVEPDAERYEVGLPASPA
jgi:hypothetical protein